MQPAKLVYRGAQAAAAPVQALSCQALRSTSDAACLPSARRRWRDGDGERDPVDQPAGQLPREERRSDIAGACYGNPDGLPVIRHDRRTRHAAGELIGGLRDRECAVSGNHVAASATIAADRFPLSPRIRTLKRILDKLAPPPPSPEPLLPPKPPGEPSLALRKKKRR